jgi:phage head maturation protease
MKTSKGILPWENLFRAVYAVPQPAVDGQEATSLNAIRADNGDGDGRTLQVQWYVADRWTEIDSWYEGHFMERIELGAASKTISENKANMRILLQHGRDPSLGEKPIAPIDFLEENEFGGFGGGRLFDGLDPLVVDGLRAGQYGASFRFRTMRDEFVQEPEPSEYNPQGIPERTIKEMAVMEFGPVTWGAYAEASAGVRSITDEMLFGALRDMPKERLESLASFWRSLETTSTSAPSDTEPEADEATASEDESREQGTEAPAEERDDKRDDATPTVEKDYLHEGRETPPWFLS